MALRLGIDAGRCQGFDEMPWTRAFAGSLGVVLTREAGANGILLKLFTKQGRVNELDGRKVELEIISVGRRIGEGSRGGGRCEGRKASH